MGLSKISIRRSKGALRLTPALLKAQTDDQIFWVNNDTQTQQPVVVNPNGTQVPIVDPISPGTASNVFAPSGTQAYTISYTLAGEPTVTGTIQVII